MKKIIALVLSAALLTSGCGSRSGIYAGYREIEHLLPVQTLGLDSSSVGVKLSVSCATSGQDSSPDIISRDGRSILRAMDSLQDYSAAGQLYYPHAQYMLLGEDYARAGIGEALDFLARDGRMRMGILLFVARETSAMELVTGPSQGKYDISGALSSVRRDTSDQGTGQAFTCRETIRRLSESGAALVCAVKSADTEGSVFLTESGKTAKADGYAILKGEQLVGYVDAQLASAASLLLDRSGTDAPVLHIPGLGYISLSMDSAKAEIKPSWNNDGSLQAIQIHAKLSASVAEVDTRSQNITASRVLEELGRLLEEDTKQRLQKVLDQCVELDADFLGFMAHLRQDQAEFADALPEDWLKKAKFNISVEAEVKDTGDLGNMMNTDGWGN